MTHTIPLSTEETNRKKNASRIATTILGATLVATVFNTILALQLKSWQVFSFVALVFFIAILAFNSLRLIRNGRFETGMWQILIGIMIMLPLGTLLVSGVGAIVGLIVVMTSYVYASQTLSAKDVRHVLIASLGVGALTAASDLLQLDFRLQVPIIQTFAPAITGLVLVFIGSFVARDAWGHSVRNKLTISFIGVALITAGILAVYVYVTTSSILRNGLEGELTQHADVIASSIGTLFDEQINTLTTLSLDHVLIQAAEDSNNSYTGNTSSIQSILDSKDALWRAADAAGNNSDPLVKEYLSNQTSLELVKFQQTFPNHVEVFATDVYGGLIGSTNRTSDYYQADEEWWQAAYNNGNGSVYISEPEFDESANALAIQIVLPLINRQTGKIVGILRTTYLASAMATILDVPVGNTGETDLLIPGTVVSHFHEGKYSPLPLNEYSGLQAAYGKGMVEMNYEGKDSIVIQVPVNTREDYPVINKLGWVVVFHQNQEEAFAPVNLQTRGTILVMAAVLLLAVAGAFGLSIFLVRPIAQLTRTAESVAAGDLNSRANIASTDEVGTLASTFNSMTSQLQETLQGLEQRVVSRTRELAVVAEIGTATATILELKRLLQEVVDLTKERFTLYHSHIYLLDEKGESLVLTAGAGDPGRIMVAEGRSIPLTREQSLVARAARERKGVTVNDVTQAPDFLPNPLLPDTRSELAVPMIVGGIVIGVFDIQSEQVGRFTESDVNIQTTLAAQLAASIQNVRSFEQSRKQAEFEAQVNLIGQKIQRATTIEETLQTAIRELGTVIGAARVKAQISRSNGEN